ncbi:hypothetical protein H2200_001306 [Cladophialophora chaetospira]|uniref:Uncharacterized protein n=1 Tax=Cladophialophora chaetospira TaxID=386627 RepID=A0AA39CPG7_9EURO|nr:hypothetical protein H2200_001306 [Cladophialophora chaetospira]
MHAHHIVSIGALALSLSSQVLVTALPIDLDYIWTRINTEIYFARMEQSNRCSGQVMCNDDPSIRREAIVYAYEADAIPAAAAATPTARKEDEPQSMTADALEQWLEMLRSDDAPKETSPGLKTQENTFLGSTNSDNEPTTKPCDNRGTCPQNYLVHYWAGGCECLGKVLAKATTTN